jgi:hypothetical protein
MTSGALTALIRGPLSAWQEAQFAVKSGPACAGNANASNSSTATHAGCSKTLEMCESAHLPMY